MSRKDQDEAVAYLMHAVERGWLWCGNCDGRKCMSCVCREYHDDCEDDCPECCDASAQRSFPARLASPLRAGWDAP